jgi:hypothetical protein
MDVLKSKVTRRILSAVYNAEHINAIVVMSSGIFLMVGVMYANDGDDIDH